MDTHTYTSKQIKLSFVIGGLFLLTAYILLMYNLW
jgi:hypothetical protein